MDNQNNSMLNHNINNQNNNMQNINNLDNLNNNNNQFNNNQISQFEQIQNNYDTIITNPPIRAGKSVIYKMYEDAKNHLKPNGCLFLVINKKHGAPSTIEFLESLFGNCEVVDKKSGFNVLKCINEE
jgi:16S rRNA (guanine1207-N2)-methyltransferase